jgi:tetratricopeptide (TPR) repeat protein
LHRRNSKLLEWLHLRLVNLNQGNAAELDEVIALLESSTLQRQSAVLTEKLGDLYWAKRKLSDALDTYEVALKRGPSTQQKTRLLLRIAERRPSDAVSYGVYQRFLKEVPDYPDMMPIYRRLRNLAENLGKLDDLARWDQEIKRLTPPPASAASPPTGEAK